MIALEGVISRVRFHHGKRTYVLSDGKSEFRFHSEETLPQGSCISLEGEMGIDIIAARKVEMLSGQRRSKAIDTAMANVRNSATMPDGPPLLKDDVTLRLWDSMREAALVLIGAGRLGRSVLLRFHGDADGVCGAFALSEVMQCKAFQHNSAAYGAKDALRDISAIGQESMPLLVLLDFGSGDGCKEGLGLLDAAGIDYLVIDHHPLSRKGDRRMLNPYSLGDNMSKYTAGYLACEIAVACGLDGDRALQLAKTACSGDKSDILNSGPEDARNAMVLDFLASHVSFGNNLDFYRKVMEKEELFRSIAQQADDSIEDATARAMGRMRRSDEGGLEIISFSLEGIVRRGEWPPSSKVTTRVFEKMSAGTPLLCIGHTERSIIMRLNDKAVECGLSANLLAGSLKKSMADFVEGGGGHARAGAIRVNEGFAKEVINELAKEAAMMFRKCAPRKD